MQTPTAKKLPLTKKQSDVLLFIKKYFAAENFPPTIKEIAENFKMKSQNQVQEILMVLEKKGHIERKTKGTSRGIKILDETIVAKSNSENPVSIKKNLDIPIIGNGTAENYISVFLNNEGKIEIAEKMFKVQPQFASKVADSGLAKLGIMEGDLAFIKQSREIADGKIVLALVNEEKLIRLYHQKSETEIELSATQANFPKIKFQPTDPTVYILGELVGVLREY